MLVWMRALACLAIVLSLVSCCRTIGPDRAPARDVPVVVSELPMCLRSWPNMSWDKFERSIIGETRPAIASSKVLQCGTACVVIPSPAEHSAADTWWALEVGLSRRGGLTGRISYTQLRHMLVFDHLDELQKFVARSMSTGRVSDIRVIRAATDDEYRARIESLDSTLANRELSVSMFERLVINWECGPAGREVSTSTTYPPFPTEWFAGYGDIGDIDPELARGVVLEPKPPLWQFGIDQALLRSSSAVLRAWPLRFKSRELYERAQRQLRRDGALQSTDQVGFQLHPDHLAQFPPVTGGLLYISEITLLVRYLRE